MFAFGLGQLGITAASAAPVSHSTSNITAHPVARVAPVQSVTPQRPGMPALTQYNVVDGAGSGWILDGEGLNKQAETTDALSTFTFDSSGYSKWDGHTVYLMRVGGGSDCEQLDGSEANGVYERACNSASSAQGWILMDDWIYSLYGAEQCNCLNTNTLALYVFLYNVGAKVFAESGFSAENNNQWVRMAA
jgi:hypothetical protein